jgi:hypothetical protein
LTAGTRCREDGDELSSTQGHGNGQDGGFAFGALLRNAWRIYSTHAKTLLPGFVLIFVLLRLLIPVVVTRDFEEGGVAFGLILVQVIVPTFVGSLMIAVACVVFRSGTESPPRSAISTLGPQSLSLLGAASIAASLAFFAIVLMGPVGILIQPALFGPPVIVHAIALEQRDLSGAWARTRQLLRRDARVPMYLLLISLVLGLAVVVVVSAADELSGGLGGTARGTLLFATQGALVGATALFVAAVGLIAYEDLAARADGFSDGTRG